MGGIFNFEFSNQGHATLLMLVLILVHLGFRLFVWDVQVTGDVDFVLKSHSSCLWDHI